MTANDPRPAPSDEAMAVRTPEHVQLNFVLAGPGTRFLALLTDLVIQWLLFLGIILGLSGLVWALRWTPGDVFGRMRPDTAGLWLLAWFLLLLFALQWGYFTVFETVWAGQTPGKRRQRIRVIRENGRPIGFAEAAIRNLLRSALDGQPYPLHAVGFVVGILNARFKRLGDFAAGTVVIVERRQSVPRLPPRPAGATSTVADAGRPRVRQLTQEEVTTLQAYLRRRGELDPGVRAGMAQKIAASLAGRLGIARPGDMSDDAFLEWLDREVRASQAFRQG
jgi:uncharacterized RDD family membrane protein YckC